MTWMDLLRRAEEKLKDIGFRLGKGPLSHEARYFLEAAYGAAVGEGRSISAVANRSMLSDKEAASVLQVLDQLLERRGQGEPLQHILGRWGFYQNEYEVSPAVLIPRPETEVLVHEVIQILPSQKPLQGAEIGLGSGVISIELLDARPELLMTATEVSADAVRVAQRNASAILKSGVDQGTKRLSIHLVDASQSPCSELERALGSLSIDFLVSNPPYLDGTQGSMEVEDDVRRSEPHTALFAPVHDLNYFYRDIATRAYRLLKPDGFVAVEIPHERAEPIESLFRTAGYQTRVESDLTGRPRVLIAKLNKKGNS